MHKKQGLDPFELLSQFIHLREHGMNRDEAWFKVCEEIEEELHEVTKQTFQNLAKNWERREGHKYYYCEQTSIHDTMTRKQVEAAQAQYQQQASPSHKVMTATLDPERLRQYNERSLEQVLDQVKETGNTAPLQEKDYFGQDTLLMMHFVMMDEPLVININGEEEMIIGRTSSNNAMAPEIDLIMVNAADYGVSRMHAAITRRNNKLLITDLGSMNYTRINGVRLLPEETKTLQDGDQVWFAQLHCQVRFKQR